MKRFLLFWIYILMVLAVFAQGQGGRNDANGQAQRELNTHVTATQAKDVGYAFMNTGGGSKRGGAQSGAVRKQSMQLVYTGRITDSLTRATTDCYYVFALQPKGFVIVAADNRVEPILGYSYDNDFVVENMPDHVCGWLSSYERQIKTAIDRDMEPVAETATKWSRLKSGQPISNTRNGNSVGPLLSTTWNQGQYYNSLCPTDANGPAGHVYTGCVATALAQIINYHQYPQHGRGTHSYSCNYGTLTVDYNSANYDYSNMPVSLTSGSTSLQVDAVATLMRDCGVAVNMGYAADESGSFDVEARAALINFFRYSPNMSYAEKAYFTNDEWETMLRNDLDAGNPVYYSGQGTGGHAFVCDGYNADGYFSFNFGWGGYCNGWYLTSNVNPGSSTFNDSQSAIFGIVPDSTGNVILGQTQGISTFIVDEPLEFYHLMGHNAYEGGNYSNSCNNTVNFVPANSNNQIVADILDFEDQSLTFYDGNNNWLRNMNGGGSNDLSPVVSNNSTLVINYSGNLYYAGFKLNISQSDGCRMVSNIGIFVDTTTAHLTWTENGTATQWQIEYGVKDFVLGTGTVYTATTNTVTLNNLTKLTEYDFYIRSICGDNQYGQWNKASAVIDGPYWQDIITSQPAGYVYDTATNSVLISTAEQLTWWAKTGDSIDGHLAADIDLSGYKWQPTALSNRNFNGHGHVLTNVYVKETYQTFDYRTNQGGCIFMYCSEGFVLENLGITNSYIQSNNRAGGLCGSVGGIMRNCYVTHSTIDGGDYVGGLVCNNNIGGGYDSGEDGGLIINCYVNANVIGNRWTGLMISQSGGNVRNCYAAGTVRERSFCYIAGIVAYATGGEITNCYSVETPMGTVGHFGSTFIADTSTFTKTGSNCTLLTPVIIDDIMETDLLSALNRGLQLYNDSMCCTWIADTGNVNGGYPVFGDKYVVQCPNVSDVSAQSVFVGDENRVILHWTENGNASQWRIRYRRHDRPDTTYTYITTTSNPDTLYGIPLGYTYDFNVRAICDTNHQSGWSETQTVHIDLPFWTDIVSSQPAEYVEDVDGNVEIYSAEALAWLSVLSNGLHDQEQKTFLGKTVTLKADVDLEGYRWFPIGNSFIWDWEMQTYHGGFSGTFDGQDHTISNIYMNTNNEHASGLFGNVYLGSVKNIRLNGGTILNGNGGLIGSATDCPEISDCHSSATIYGDGGSLCGGISGTTYVFNCSSSGTVYGHSKCGSLIGAVDGNVEVYNCYATGDVKMVEGGDQNWYRGGLIGYIRGAHVNNCFSTGTVERDKRDYRWYGKVIGILDHYDPHIHYVYGPDTVIEGMDLIGKPINGITYISDTSQFHHDGNTNALLSPILIDGMTYSDMLDALNAWVILQNNPKLRLWILDSITGYPIFGDYYIPSCYDPADLTVSQATTPGDAIIKTRLTWTQEGEPDHWEVRYVAKGQSVEIGTSISIDSNSCVLAGIPIGMPLDFYVRAFCGEDDASGWCGPVTYLPDKLRWTEVVTSQPEGFQEDGNGNVYISSAEGLSWISSIVNELNDAPHIDFNQIILTKDIDLSAYRWDPIGDWYHWCNASFNGNNHVIFGLYCNELSGLQGLFGQINGEIKNLVLTRCDVRYLDEDSRYVGGIVGYSYGNHIVNCMVTGSVCGGGIAGTHTCNYWNVNNIENCCFIGNDNIKGNPVGITSSSLGGGISNCYVVNTDATTTSARYYIGDEENSGFTGSGSNWTLTIPQYINGAFHTDLEDALNAWVDANNTNEQYNHWVSDTNMVNGGYPVFESVSLPAVTAQDTVVAQGYYSWHGMVFTSDTVVTDTLYTLNGYDSVVTYHIFVNPIPITQITVDTCSDYTWNGETYSKTGDYVQTFPTVTDADSVVILHLAINPLTGVDEHYICDNSYTWIDGVTYTANNNTATYTLQTADGCDSVATLHLTFGHKTASDTVAMACNSYDWYEQANLTQSGDYTRILTNANGCDSVVTLHLTIGHPATAIDEQIACDSFTWIDGNTYTESTNEPTFTLTTTTGCDSVVTLHLIVNHTTYVDTTVIAYDSFDWYEYTGLTQSGNYTRTLTNAAGCDSIVTLHLTINTLYWTDVVTSQPEGYQEDENGNVYISSAEGLAWLSSVVNGLNGAQNKRFNHIVLTNDIDLSAYRWKAIGNGNNEANFLQCASFNGNNHIVSGLNCQESESYVGLFGRVEGGEIHNLILTQCEVHGIDYVGGIVGSSYGNNIYNCMVNGNVSGGQSVGGIVGFSLMLFNLENSCFIGTVNANYCSGGISGGLFVGGAVNCYAVNETTVEGMITGTCYNPNFVSNCYYKENGTNTPITGNECITSNNSGFTGSGTTWTLSTPPYINGIYYTDLVDALNAWVDSSNSDGRYCRWAADTAMVNGGYPVMSYPVHTAITIDTCGGYSWGGETYYTSGDYTYSHLDANGCTQVDTLHLTVRSITGDTTVTVCDSFDWYEHTGITQSCENLTHTFTNVAGCDSVVTLHLTIVHSATTIDEQIACDSFTWIDGNTYTESTNEPTITLMNAAGCDSVVTLHLTISHADSADFAVTACGSYEWNGEIFTTTGDYTRTLTCANGCDSIVTLHLTIMPTPTAIVLGSHNICESEPVVLNAIVDANGFSLENLHYTWYANGQVQDNMMYGLGDNNEYAEFWDPGTEPYHFMVEVSFGTDASCVFQSDEYLVYVHRQPSVFIVTSETTICEGSTATLTAWADGSLNPSYDYQWFRSIPGYTTEFVGIGATYTTMGNEPVNDYTYWVQVTSENGCSSQSNPIILNVTPSPYVIISGNTEICFGNTATLYANVVPNQVATYVWYKDGGSVIAYNTPLVTVTEGGTYMVEATVNGCQATDNITITVYDAPVTPIVTVDHTTIYDGGEVTLSITNPDPDPLTSYTWYRNGEVIPGATQTIIVDNPMTVGGETTSYVYTVAASHLFSSCAPAVSASVVVTVSSLPVATVTVYGNTVLCEGSYVTLHVDVSPYDNHLTYSYQWYEDGMLIPGATSADYNVIESGRTNPYNFMVMVSAMTGGFNITAYAPAITVLPAPMVTAFISDTSICEGSTATLTAWVNGSIIPNYDYQWCRSIPGSIAELVGIGATYTTMGDEPANNYTFWVLVSSEYGCSYQSDPITLTVNQPTTGIDVQTACGSYTWIDGITYTESTNTATYTLTNAAGCDSIVTLHLTISQTPLVQISATRTSICVDGYTTIMAEVNNLYDDNIFYSWSDGNFGSFNDFFPNSSGSFTVTVTATHLPSGCASTGEITINVNDNPETPVVTVDHTTIYDGGIVTLSVINPVADAVYTWYRNGVLIAEATNYVLTDYLTTIDGGEAYYRYIVRAQLPMSGCVSNFSASTMVTVNPLPVATVTAYGNTVLCEGGSVMLHVDVSPYDNLTYSYQWYEDGMLIPGATSADYNVIESARTNPYHFMVMVSAMTGGFNITAYAPAITVVPAPMVTAFISDTAICEGSTATLTALVDGGLNPNYDYQWYRSTPGSIAELVGIGATYTTIGNEPVNDYTYWVQVTSENGCSSQSNPITLTINQPTTGIDVQTVCGSYTWIDGITYTESNNTATYTLTNAAGCDSVVTLNLTINQPATGTDVQTACGSYTWIDGITYTESNNTATYTLTNAAGCDSVVTLNLTINQPATGTDMQTACGSFTWIDGVTYTENNNTATYTLTNAAGCDSVVTLHLTVNHASTRDTSAVACGSFTWYGTTYTQTGDYTRLLTNAAGCDSTVTLHLTIIPYDTITLAVNDTLMGSVALAGVLPEGAADLGGGSYRVPRGTELTVKALFDTADFGFLFWTRGNDTLSVDSVYTFTVMGSDEYTAHFEYLPTPYFYVSKTGWATWINPHSGPGAFTRVDVKAADSDQWETLNYSSSITCVQIPSFMLTDSTLYTVRAVLYNYEPSFESREVTFDWFYVACDHFEGVSNFEGEITDQGVALSWDAGEGPQQYLLYRNYSIIDTLTTTSYIDTSGVYSNKYYVRRMFGGSAVCPYNNDSLSMSCQTEARIYIDLTLTTDPLMFGTAAFVLPDNTGHVAIGGTCTVSATANEGYSFTHWTFNGTKVSVQSTYSFDVEQEGELVAHFEYAPATDLYVSRTGWASWNNSHSQPGDNSCVSAQVTLKSIDGQVLFTQTFSQPSANHCQLPTGNFADSTLYLMSVVLADTAGNSSEATTQWYYVACDHLSGFDTVSGVFGQQGVNLSWDYPSSMTFTTATVDYDLFNGFVTDTAVMSNGGDASWAVEPQSTAGPYCNYASNVWVGDRITLSDTTRISEMEVYAFQNDFSTTSPFTGLYIQIYQGSPADSVLVWGNADSNLMTATAFTGCYRGLESNSMIFNLRRPIMSLTASGLDIELSPGTYYFVWSVSVSNTINPVAIPHCEPVVGNTGDYGMLYTEDHGWHTMHDGGSGEPFGFAFHLTGEQVLSPVVEPEATAIYRNGELIDITSSTTYTDSEGSADHSYEVRVVYGGDRHCVYGNAAMSMSCPQPVTLHCGETFTGDTTAVACESFTWYGTTYTETPTVAPTHTLTNASGCDSVVTLHLTINTSVAESVEATACDNYIWNGVAYAESGDYTQTFTAVNGCDSVVTLHLTVNPSFSIEAYLTISENDLPYTYGDTTFMPGTVQSGDYTFNFTTTDGCDSVIILHLTVETGINDYSLNASMKLYPNPTKDLVNVQLTINNEQLDDVVIQLFDVYGKMLDVIKLQSGTSLQTQIDLSRYANGVYLIKAVAEGNVLAVRKVVKR